MAVFCFTVCVESYQAARVQGMGAPLSRERGPRTAAAPCPPQIQLLDIPSTGQSQCVFPAGIVVIVRAVGTSFLPKARRPSLAQALPRTAPEPCWGVQPSNLTLQQLQQPGPAGS